MRSTNILALLGSCIPVFVQSFEKSNQVYIVFYPANETSVDHLLAKAAESFVRQDYPVQEIESYDSVPLFSLYLGLIAEKAMKSDNISHSIHDDDRNKGPPLYLRGCCFSFHAYLYFVVSGGSFEEVSTGHLFSFNQDSCIVFDKLVQLMY
ncbi:MAG: hypothetical protein WC087_00845 [Candidatus Paceibacterota bacterium]